MILHLAIITFPQWKNDFALCNNNFATLKIYS